MRIVVFATALAVATSAAYSADGDALFNAYMEAKAEGQIENAQINTMAQQNAHKELDTPDAMAEVEGEGEACADADGFVDDAKVAC
mmetsp:Transcript_19742/g.24368  ORF Transcript_19742/g.24368 Transcript_19742/m.24368 type:complete len:86 (+) Transcript_19742:111-368(+)|eukprot:CAMPEP_0170469512 /NCGR_PEP_ID=MMETSP0123-20130129/12313_1 /TAXON_ID=182087 /ORGANISM="Favella ehrenbergii, Strain Fehren 1" /LENGTH=85 /DNA_ID=CAMNT_0010736397 /DNA_START=108 /DNA_END=365 /DNA_ORIENTATION=-